MIVGEINDEINEILAQAKKVDELATAIIKDYSRAVDVATADMYGWQQIIEHMMQTGVDVKAGLDKLKSAMGESIKKLSSETEKANTAITALQDSSKSLGTLIKRERPPGTDDDERPRTRGARTNAPPTVAETEPATSSTTTTQKEPIQGAGSIGYRIGAKPGKAVNMPPGSCVLPRTLLRMMKELYRYITGNEDAPDMFKPGDIGYLPWVRVGKDGVGVPGGWSLCEYRKMGTFPDEAGCGEPYGVSTVTRLENENDDKVGDMHDDIDQGKVRLITAVSNLKKIISDGKGS